MNLNFVHSIGLACLLTLGAPWASQAVGQDETERALPSIEGAEEFRRWYEHVLPSAEEQAWLGLGWGSQLHSALERARAGQRPVLLWAMNGHPLGCV